MAILGRCCAWRTFNGVSGMTNLLQVTATSYYFDIRQTLPGGALQPYGNALLFVHTGGGPIAFNLASDTTVRIAPGIGWTVQPGMTLLLDETEPAVTNAAYLAAMTTNQGSGTAVIFRGTTQRFLAWEDPDMTLSLLDPPHGSNASTLQPFYTLGTPCR